MKRSGSATLGGCRVTMIVTNDVWHDTRVRQEATSLVRAGAHVTVVGVGHEGRGLERLAFDLVLVDPWAGSEAALWPLRVATNLLREWRQGYRLAREVRRALPTVVHCHDLDTLGVGFAVARGRLPVVYDSHEIYLAQYGAMPWWRRKALARQERRLAARASLVITVNEAVADELVGRYSIRRPLIVYNGSSECRAAQPVESPLRVFCQGSYTEERGLPQLIEAMVGLRGRAVLTLQGYGPLERTLRRQVSELGLQDSIQFIDPCRPEDVIDWAARFDVGIVATRPTCLNSQLSSPNKLFAYLGGALAIATPDIPVVRAIVESYRCGIVFDAMEPESIAGAIARLAASPSDVMRMKRNSSHACDEYRWDRQSDVLIRAYADICQSART